MYKSGWFFDANPLHALLYGRDSLADFALFPFHIPQSNWAFKQSSDCTDMPLKISLIPRDLRPGQATCFWRYFGCLFSCIFCKRQSPLSKPGQLCRRPHSGKPHLPSTKEPQLPWFSRLSSHIKISAQGAFNSFLFGSGAKHICYVAFNYITILFFRPPKLI